MKEVIVEVNKGLDLDDVLSVLNEGLEKFGLQIFELEDSNDIMKLKIEPLK